MFESILGSVLLVAIVGLVTLLVSFINLKEKFVSWRKNAATSKFKKAYLENHPEFKVSLSFPSNYYKGECMVSFGILNLSNEVKFIEQITYRYALKDNPNQQLPTSHLFAGDKWPKRLEHGERLDVSVPFHHDLFRNMYDYWKREVKVYATCQTTTGDLIKSNSVDYDTLIDVLEPLNHNYLKLAARLAKLNNSSKRNLTVTLWQLQRYKYLTSHIAKQLQRERIPIIEYLIKQYDYVPVDNLWVNWQHNLNRDKIDQLIVVSYLETFLRNKST